MRLAIDLRSLIETGGRISGVENYVLNTVNRLEQKKQTDFLLFYNSYKTRQLPVHLNPEMPLKSSKIPNKIFNASLQLFNFPKFENLYGDFDVLWMPDLRPFAIQDKTKLVITVHDLSPIIHPEFFSLRRRIWHSLINYKKAFTRADMIFAVSEYTKFDLVKIFGLNPEKIKVIYPGVDHQIFKPDLDERLKHKVKSKYNLPDKYILAISTIEPRKNLTGLIEAFEKITDPETHLVIAGRLGWIYKLILEKIKSSSKKDHIKLIGYIDEADKPYLISQAEILCYPSFYEGFGFQPIEAMACGVPVITSARTSMPEICGDAALLVEPYHLEDLVAAINGLLSDPQLRHNLINKGLNQSKKFTWENCVRQIEQQLTTLS